MQIFIGQVELFPYSFVPDGWLACNGQLLTTADHMPLFNFIGTTYGGDGKTTFAVPNLNARFPMGIGAGPGLPAIALGQTGGAEYATLTQDTLPSHSHPVAGASQPSSASPKGRLPAAALEAGEELLMYGIAEGDSLADSAVVAAVGSGQPLPIRNPYLGLLYCIAVSGSVPQA
jgi:microcystin-dependent protein